MNARLVERLNAKIHVVVLIKLSSIRRAGHRRASKTCRAGFDSSAGCKLRVWYTLNMKQCQECKQTKEYAEFAGNKSKKDGYSDKCRSCKSIYNKKYYEKTKDIHNPARYERRKNAGKEVRDFIIAYKDNKECLDCGVSYRYWQLDFDHLRDKDFTIGRDARDKSLDTIMKEIEKCDLVCANCHRTRSFVRQFGPQALK